MYTSGAEPDECATAANRAGVADGSALQRATPLPHQKARTAAAMAADTRHTLLLNTLQLASCCRMLPTAPPAAAAIHATANCLCSPSTM
jgi:hypothetical protein